MAKTLAQLATEANSYLYRDKETDRVLPQRNCPQWFTDLCRNAHCGGEMGPDDWRYEFIQDALNAIENDDTGETEPDVDNLYPYTADRLKWLASRLDRYSYCDEAMAEWGTGFTDTATLVGFGMQFELLEVYSSVRRSLEDRLQTEAEETEEAE